MSSDDPMSIATRMSPEDRAELESIAVGFGNMLMVEHRHHAEHFADRNPGCVTLRQGYFDRTSGRWSRSGRWFSIQITPLGAQIALLNRLHRLPIAETEGATDEQ